MIGPIVAAGSVSGISDENTNKLTLSFVLLPVMNVYFKTIPENAVLH